MVSPGRAFTQPGLSFLTREPVSRILFYAVIPLGAALPRTLISDLPGGSGTCSSRLATPGRHGARALALGSAHPSLFGLAPCGVYPATGITASAVRSYRTFSPLPGIGCPRSLAFGDRGKLIPAVCFLWHLPSTGLHARVPDVIRHTALRSSDFPLPAARLRKPRQRPPGPPASVQSTAKRNLPEGRGLFAPIIPETANNSHSRRESIPGAAYCAAGR